MKRIFYLLIMCLILVSCSSLSSSEKEADYTKEEALFAVRVAATAAYDNSSKTFYNSVFNEDTFIPEQYRILEEMKKEIPGMTRTLNDFRLYFSSLLLDGINELFDFTESKLTNIKTDYPEFYVISSNTSISDNFINSYSKEMNTIVRKIVNKADYSLLRSAISSYNSYINVKSVSKPKLSESDFVSLFTEYITDNYCEILRKSEELFRTTPSPYSDETVKKVFKNY